MTATGTTEGQPELSTEISGPLLGDVALPAVEERSEPTPEVGSVPDSSEEELTFLENPVCVVAPEGLSAMGEAALARGYMWIPLAAPGPQYRGRLGLYIEDSIETLLEERGALPPGIQASTGLDASLSDQLYRARLVEMRGIALGIPSLEGITNLGRALDAEDSAVLRWWMAATSDRPVRVVISQENTKLRVYPSPVLFETLFEVAPGPVTPIPPSPSMAESSQSMDLSDLPPQVAAAEETNVFGTQVAPVSDDEDERSEEVSSLDENVEEAVADLSFDAEEEDVDLPDLDRALGLSPEAPSARPPEVKVARREKTASKKKETVPEKQLALDYESSEPPRTTLIAAPAPEANQESFETAAESVEEKFDECSVQSAAEAAVDSEESSSREESVDSDDVTASASDDGFADSELVQEEPTPSEVFAKPAQEELDEDIDEEEFLRTLAEDSSRAPEVSPSEEPQVAVAEELSPLPTKKIVRNPFIRMADPAEAHVENESSESDTEVAHADSEIAAPTDVTDVDDAPVHFDAPEADPILASEEPVEAEAPVADPADPFNQLATREWKTWKTNLEAARGPKPLSVIERMFVTDYTRLREAVRRGVANTSANEILDEWRDSFTESYSEAFDALRVRGKRPTMVLDLPELAARLGRLQGARRVQLLLVDGMRFDLGLMIQERMRKVAEASLTERLLLWSALPTVTSHQLELLGKGPDGLKEQGRVDESPALVARGAAAKTARRVRTGSLELLKLDVVADSLRHADVPVVERMDAIADDASEAIVAHMAKQPPRTMVVVFGDHGFSLDPAATGTTEEVRQGGATPEEVLVPAFAWLTGQVH